MKPTPAYIFLALSSLSMIFSIGAASASAVEDVELRPCSEPSRI